MPVVVRGSVLYEMVRQPNRKVHDITATVRDFLNECVRHETDQDAVWTSGFRRFDCLLLFFHLRVPVRGGMSSMSTNARWSIAGRNGGGSACTWLPLCTIWASGALPCAMAAVTAAGAQ